jgi:hypothetical protein
MWGIEGAMRGLSQTRGGGAEEPDLIGVLPGCHLEVKRVEKLNIHSAVQQASDDAGEHRVPVVIHRRNRGKWLVTLYAEDAIALGIELTTQCSRDRYEAASERLERAKR